MRYCSKFVLAGALLFGASVVAMGGNVRTDYNHGTNFAQYHTYSWGRVQASDPFYVDRIKQAVDKELQGKGWQLQASDGAVTIVATDNIHNQQELQTMYDGWGGGWGGGWGWRGWGWRGGWAEPTLGSATTTTTNQPVANLVIDLFDAKSKNLLWRGLATENLSTKADNNTKQLEGDVNKMFKGFPPKVSH
jgi:hypothetical protein